jgi:tetratricopeptide (TPR) repeat protein
MRRFLAPPYASPQRERYFSTAAARLFGPAVAELNVDIDIRALEFGLAVQCQSSKAVGETRPTGRKKNCAHYEAALKIRKNLLGDKHIDVASVCVNLSNVFHRLGRVDEALAMCSSALEIYNKAPGNNHKNIANCHNNIGNCLREQGKHDEAMEHFSIGLAITLKTEGESAGAADFLVNIGAVLSAQNKLDEAMEKHVSALRINEKAKLDTSIATCHYNIGGVLMKQGKLDAALEHARKALTIRRSKLSQEHDDCGESHNLIGEILKRSGKFAEALDEFDNALRIFKNVYGEMTLQVAAVYEFKAACFFELQKWREAVTFYEATIHIRTVLLGADDAHLVKLKARVAKAEEQLKAERSSAAASEQRK